ncbi:MAG: hypothetical protein ACLRWQ_07495 [Flavonifractor plautii]
MSCQVSMEERMACGVRACLVCACKMADGTMKHACKDGPSFDGREVDVGCIRWSCPWRWPGMTDEEPGGGGLRVRSAFGREYGRFYDLSELGGHLLKGLHPLPQGGQPASRIAETPMGILNSVGLQNPGVDAFIAEELPELRKHDLAVIANISGNTPEEYGVMCEKLSAAGVDMIEVNISCPNVKAGGLAYGTKPELAAEVTGGGQGPRRARVPVMVKLSPNVTDVTEIARAVADARRGRPIAHQHPAGMRIDVNTRRPILKMNTGGLSGPAVLPVAVRDGVGGGPGRAPAHPGHGRRSQGGGRGPAPVGWGLRRGGGHRLL